MQSNEFVYPMQLVEFVSVDSTFANAFYFCSVILIVSILLAFLLEFLFIVPFAFSFRDPLQFLSDFVFRDISQIPYRVPSRVSF